MHRPALTKPPYAADSGSLAVRCGKLIDGLAREVRDDQVVVIEHGRIAAVVDGAAGGVGDMPQLDLSDCTCLPGLINTHVHLGEIPEYAADYATYYSLSESDNKQLALASARASLLSGFTTVRNVGDFYPKPIYDARESIQRGQAIGPRIQTAGPFITIPGGAGDLNVPGRDESEIPAATRTGIGRTPAEFAAAAERAVAGGADFLKVLASGAVFSHCGIPGAPEMHQEDIEAVVAVARKAGLKVTSHVHSAQSARDSILAGVDSLEHASLLDDEAIALAAEHGVILSMDIYNGTYTEEVGREQGYPEEFMRKNRETTEAQRVVFEKALALGLPLVFGTDAGVHPHHMSAWQFGVMVERGMTPMQAIQAATSAAAEHMGMAGDVGAIEPGRYGDLIAVAGDPLDKIDVLKDVGVVVKGGLVFKL
jgi:imidazolonepropionase-like amidohydrolase